MCRAPVAQLDRAVASGATGREFESLRAHQIFLFRFTGLPLPIHFRECRLWAQLGAQLFPLYWPAAFALPASAVEQRGRSLDGPRTSPDTARRGIRSNPRNAQHRGNGRRSEAVSLDATDRGMITGSTPHGLRRRLTDQGLYPQRPKAYFFRSEKRRFALRRVYVGVSVAHPTLVP